MAQVNIAHFTKVTPAQSRDIAAAARNVAAKEIHGLEIPDIRPGSVSVWVFPIDTTASMSGADTEIQLLVSGNNWPQDGHGEPANDAEAKKHFDDVAGKVYEAVAAQTNRNIYVWVTPYVASGWAEKGQESGAA